jgi:MFS family permease
MKAVVAVVIGNWLEFYDFLVYTFFAVMIGDAFFPAESEIGRLLGALATFGVGFVTRPLGAAIIGPYADRVGRRAALTLTLLLMSLGSGMVALTPPYSQIGIAAPILLVIARLIQGFSCGGEVGPATTYLLESAPPHKRAALTAWQAYSQQLASIMGAGIGVILAASLSREQLYAWGWRIPFLLGVLIAPVALYIRRQLPETIDEGQTHRSTGAVLSELMRHHSRAVVFGVLIICGGTVSTYVFNYMTTFAITTLHLSATIATALGVAGSVAQIAGPRGRGLARSPWAQAHADPVPGHLRAGRLPGVSDPDRRRRNDGNDRRLHHVSELSLRDRYRRGLRVHGRGISAGRAVERAGDSLRDRGDGFWRHHAIRRRLAHRRDKGPDGPGVVSDHHDDRLNRRDPAAHAARRGAAGACGSRRSVGVKDS